MRHLSWIITVPVTAVVVVFAIANRETTVINFWPLPQAVPLPLYLIVLGCLLIGFLFGAAVAWLSGGRHRRQARRANEQARALARQVGELQRQLTPPMPAAPPAPAAGASPSYPVIGG